MMMAEKKKEIEAFGLKNEDLSPFVKNSFKKALDNLLKRKKGSDKNKRGDESEEEVSMPMKKDRSSNRGMGSVLHKRQVSRLEPSLLKGLKTDKFERLSRDFKSSSHSISVQVNYKIGSEMRRPSKNITPPSTGQLIQ